jgi:hypothetical protein
MYCADDAPNSQLYAGLAAAHVASPEAGIVTDNPWESGTLDAPREKADVRHSATTQ